MFQMNTKYLQYNANGVIRVGLCVCVRALSFQIGSIHIELYIHLSQCRRLDNLLKNILLGNNGERKSLHYLEY